MILDREVKILFRKEWRQLTANRGAVIGALVVPFVALVVMPGLLLWTIPQAKPGKGPSSSVAFFAEVGDDPRRIAVALLPFLIAMTGVIVPTMLTSYLVISERESRTLELLVALPVRIDQILRAKLLAVIVATTGLTGPLILLDCIVPVVLGVASVGDVVGLPFLLASVLAYSTSASLLVSLLARDFRTANSVAGFFMVPAILISLVGTGVLPGGWIRPVVLGCVFALAALVLTRSALRSASFERLMS